MMRLTLLYLVTSLALLGRTNGDPTNEEMRDILSAYNEEAQGFCTASVDAEWEFNVDTEGEGKLEKAVSWKSQIKLGKMET